MQYSTSVNDTLQFCGDHYHILKYMSTLPEAAKGVFYLNLVISCDIDTF